jgi:hypothetical protein
LSAVEGDWVIRIEDVESAIRRMRSRIDAYRPVYVKRGRERGGARGNREYEMLK